MYVVYWLAAGAGAMLTIFPRALPSLGVGGWGVGAGACGCSHCPGVLTLLSHIDKGAFYPVATWQVGVET